jgi:hypothetical protein
VSGRATTRMDDEAIERLDDEALERFASLLLDMLSGQEWLRCDVVLREARRARGREEALEKALREIANRTNVEGFATFVDPIYLVIHRIARAALAGKP